MPKFLPPTKSDLLPGEEFRVILDDSELIRGQYMISNMGRVWSIRLGRELILSPCSKGYLRIDVKIRGVRVRKRVHRLVLQTFRGMPTETRSITDHIDGDKTNNRLSNLEWVDYYENNRRMFERLQEVA